MAAPIKGTKQANTLNGTNNNDKIQGKDGDDLITGGGGNDNIDGGAGYDTAFYSGSYSNYTIDVKGTGNDKVTVTDNVGNDGVDSLKHVEALQFSDALVLLGGGGGPVAYYVNAEVDEAAQETGTETILAGTGIPATGFGIARAEDAGLELGLQVTYRNGPVVLSTDNYADGVLEFNVNDGPQPGNANRAAWNYNWSITSGLNGETTDLQDFEIKLLIDRDAGTGVQYAELLLKHDDVLGTGNSDYYWDAGLPVPFISDDDGIDPTVTQNSQNYGFGAHQALLLPGSTYTPGAGFTGPAHFDIKLQAFDLANNLIAENHIQVNAVL